MSQSGGYDLNQSGGYDYKFMVEPSEDFICTLCHLVLKNPLQLEDCGHIFCKCCYENMKSHTEANFLELLCPLDRQKIHPTHVFKDKATERKILNLKVQCQNFSSDGCTWTGELRNIQNHEESCPKNQVKEYKLFGIELKQLVNRMAELELKVKRNEQSLVEKDIQITKQCKTIENLNKEVKELAKQIVNQNKTIDNQTKQFKNQTKQQVDNQTNKIDNLINKQIEDHNKQNKNKKLQIKQINEQIENQTLQIKSIQQHTNIIIPSSKDSNDLSAVCTAFEWEFNLIDGPSETSSPFFYNSKNRHCFQLYICFDDEDVSIYLSRYRGKYDLDSDEAITKTDKFVFNIYLLGSNGYKKELEYNNATGDDEFSYYSISENEDESQGCFKRILFKDEIDMLTVDGCLNMLCSFK